MNKDSLGDLSTVIFFSYSSVPNCRGGGSNKMHQEENYQDSLNLRVFSPKMYSFDPPPPPTIRYGRVL